MSRPTIYSTDRSYCVDRCNERGVCFEVDFVPTCYCDDGRIGGTCDGERCAPLIVPSPVSVGNVLWIVFGLILVVTCALLGWVLVKRILRRRTELTQPTAPPESLSDAVRSVSLSLGDCAAPTGLERFYSL